MPCGIGGSRKATLTGAPCGIGGSRKATLTGAPCGIGRGRKATFPLRRYMSSNAAITASIWSSGVEAPAVTPTLAHASSQEGSISAADSM